MRHSIHQACALLLLSVASPAFAQDAPASAFTISGGATLVSDYRFRGISQTNKRFAVQGTFTVSHSSGLYGTVWGSSVDDYVAAGSDQEIDLIAGYKKTFGNTTVDGGVLYYYYPGSGGGNSDFVEPYVSVSRAFGAVTGKISAAYAPKQHGLSFDAVPRRDGLYLAGDLSATVPDTSVSVTGHVGHSFQQNYITFGREYTDWSVGLAYGVKNLTFGVSYVDTDVGLYNGTRNLSKAGVVGTIGVVF